MSGILAILLVALIIWRLYNIAKVVFTEDFFKGCCILVCYLFAILCFADHSPIMGTLIMILGGFLAVKFRNQARIRISNGWTVGSGLFMALFILIVSFLFGMEGEIMLILAVGVWLMVISSQFRLPWFIGIQLCLLGLVVANVSDNGRLDGVDTMDMSAAEASAPIGGDYSVGTDYSSDWSIGYSSADTGYSSADTGYSSADTGYSSGWGTDAVGMGAAAGDAGMSSYSADTGSSHGYESSTTTMMSDSAGYTPADETWYRVSDPSMSPQGSLAMDSNGEGRIYDELNTQVGTISPDAMSNMVMKDNWGHPIGTVDANGFVYDASGTPIAQVEHSGGVNTVRILDGDEIILDNNGFMTDRDGKVVGSFRQK